MKKSYAAPAFGVFLQVSLFTCLCFLNLQQRVRFNQLQNDQAGFFAENQNAQDAKSDWLTRVQQGLEETEYNIRYQESADALQSPNRAQNLRFTYFKDGFSMKTRSDTLGIENWQIKMSLNGVYRGTVKKITPINNPVQEIENNHLQYHHADGLTMEYKNDRSGMRQNFILEEKPEGEGELSVLLDLESDLKPHLSSEKELFFAEEKGETIDKKVRYQDLKVFDAQGNILDSKMKLVGNQLALVVNDEKASYPIVIDPVSTTAATQLENNQANALMGYSVSGAGDVNGDGYSDVIVGAHNYDNGESNEGAAFIYHGSASGISPVANTMLESNQVNAYMGYSVSSGGDVNGDGYADVIVGSYRYDNGQSNEGVAFVYHGSASGVSTTIASLLESNQASASFGRCVSGAGDVNGDGFSDVIVGAYYYDNGQTNEGAAFVYHGSPAGVILPAADTLESNQAHARMGSSASSAGDVNGDGYADVIVGCYGYDNGHSNEGAAFVYHGSASGVSTTIASLLEINQASAFFGGSVSSAGDVNGDGYSDVIVGADRYDNGQTDEGGAFVFHGSTSGISTTFATQTESDQAYANMGCSASCAGDVNEDGFSDVIVGAYRYDDGEVDEGAAFLFYGSGSGIINTISPVTQYESDQANAYFGRSVKSAGDVNGDGYPDLIMGAYGYDNGQTDEGAAFVYQGFSVEGLYNVFGFLRYIDVRRDSSMVGRNISDAGDINGDGFDDFIFSVYKGDPVSESYSAVIYYGGKVGPFQVDTIIGNSTVLQKILTVGAAGDVNGDGYSDIIMGNDTYSNGQTAEGAFAVFMGSALGLNSSPVLLIESNQSNAHMGFSLACAGDVNKDGYSDVMVGAYGYDNGQIDEGAAFIYHGSSTGLVSTPATLLESNQAGAEFSNSNFLTPTGLKGAGDLNGDGYSDVVVGAEKYDNGQTDEGAAYVYHGSATGISPVPVIILESNEAGALFGGSVSGAGDVNGDGYGDLVIGARKKGAGLSGGVYTYYGSATGVSAASFTLISDNTALDSDYFGFGVSGGDVNGDGYSDILFTGLNEKVSTYLMGTIGIYGGPAGIHESNTIWGFGWCNFQASANPEVDGCANVCGVGDIDGDGAGDFIHGCPLAGGVSSTWGWLDLRMTGRDSIGLGPFTYRQDMITPLGDGEGPSSEAQFTLGQRVRSFQGRQKVKLVWEVVEGNQPFSGVPFSTSTTYTGESSSWLDVGTIGKAGIEMKEMISKLPGRTKWRVRLRYNQVNSLTGQVFGPWYYGPHILDPINLGPFFSGLLPVEWGYWAAEWQEQGQSALLEWSTNSESNNALFEIERSFNGSDFNKVGDVAGAGTTTIRQDYDFTDTQFDYIPSDATEVYYRLKQVDLDGGHTYSEIRILALPGAASQLKLWPNPASDQLNVQYRVGMAGYQLEIVDLTGRKVYASELGELADQFSVDVSTLKAGIYFVTMTNGKEKLTRKMIIQ